MTGESNGLKWGEKFPGYHQLQFIPGDSQSSLLVNGVQYPGSIEVYHHDGKFDVINEVEIEHYLKSVLSNEFPDPTHEELMNAVTILARTNILFNTQYRSYAFWHVAADEVGYRGLAFIPKGHVERSIRTTQHMVLTYNGSPFPVTWTQHCAGKTADFASIFRQPHLTPRGVVAPLAAKDRGNSRWACTISKEAVAKVFELKDIQAIDLYIHPETGKAYGVKLTADSKVKTVPFLLFQNSIGKDKIRSNDFTLNQQGDKLSFTGFGEGPGVGLCLYTGKLLAEGGDKAPKILESFFPDTKLEKRKKAVSEASF